MNERDKYRRRFYCKMTCEGGSEQGLCACVCPADCTSSEQDKRVAAHNMVQRLRRDVEADRAIRLVSTPPSTEKP